MQAHNLFNRTKVHITNHEEPAANGEWWIYWRPFSMRDEADDMYDVTMTGFDILQIYINGKLVLDKENEKDDVAYFTAHDILEQSINNRVSDPGSTLTFAK